MADEAESDVGGNGGFDEMVGGTHRKYSCWERRCWQINGVKFTNHGHPTMVLFIGTCLQ